MAPPPKSDPTAITYLTVRQYGGEVGSSAVLAPKLGPMGLNAKKTGEDISKGTTAWKGVKVTVRLAIQNRQATIEVVPTATALVLKALKEPVRDRKKVKNIKHSGNLSLETIIDIARTMRAAGKGVISKTLAGTTKEILGTCNAVGCTVDGKKPTEIQKAIGTSIEIPVA